MKPIIHKNSRKTDGANSMWLKKIFQTGRNQENLQVLQNRLENLEMELEKMKKMNRKLSYSVHILLEAQMKDSARDCDGFPPALQVS